MKHLGDITKMTPENTPHVDCVTFGSPCQDLSIAGKREGLAGARSGLFMDAVRIIKNMQLYSFGACPKFAVWENVPGAFSSNKGEDFRAVLEELARIKEPEVSIPRPEGGKWAKAGFISGNGWSIAWRTLDAQFWGVPQRRRRIALVMDLGGQRAGEILFERTGLSGYLEPSIPPWQGIARDPAHCAAGYDQVVEGEGDCLTPWDVQSRRIYEASGKWPSIYSGEGGGHGYVMLKDCTAYPDTARALTARHDGSPCVDRGPNVVCLQGNMIDREVQQNGSGIAESETMFTLNTTDRHGVCAPVAFSKEAYNTEKNARCSLGIFTDGTAPTVRADTHPSGVVYKIGINGDVAGTLDASYYKGTGARSGMEREVAFIRTRLRWIVRRLTPTECERLQGFPDGWTDIGEWIDSKGKRHKPADSPRYKALGNSVALPQWWWLTCKMARYLPEHATLGSLFDGIGGFPLVWETYHGKGTAVWASEIEEFPIAVTKKRFERLCR